MRASLHVLDILLTDSSSQTSTPSVRFRTFRALRSSLTDCAGRLHRRYPNNSRIRTSLPFSRPPTPTLFDAGRSVSSSRLASSSNHRVDITPTTTSSRIFSGFYDTLGVVLLAFTVSVARDTIIESFEISFGRKREALVRRLRAHQLRERESRTKEWEWGKVERLERVEAGVKERWWRVRNLGGWRRSRVEDSERGIGRTLTKNALTEEQHLKKETKKARRREFAIQTGVSLVLFLSLWMVRGRALGLI